MKKNKNNQQSDKWFINSNIRASKVLCIDANGKNLGTIHISQALELASNAGLDLVQMPQDDKNNSAPLCKIINFGKFKYELSIKKKEMDKKQRDLIVKVKEVNMKPNIAINDLQNKANQTQGFIDDGYKVKVNISFPRKSHQKDFVTKELILNTFENFWSFLENCQIESSDTKEERSASFLIKKADK